MPAIALDTAPEDTLASLNDGDRVEVVFDPPLKEDGVGLISRARGPVRRIVGRTYLIDELHRTSWSMSPCLELDGASLRKIQVLATAAEVAADRARKARGNLVFASAPASPQEVEERLIELAGMIEASEDPRRRRELRLQFHDTADHVKLAKRKRNYLLCRARLGQDFNPWTWPDDRVYRNETVRPLPSDFLLDPEARRDRGRRLEEAVRIFGEAEREARRLASLLALLGYDVRRPHPNAQELLVRFRRGRGAADLAVRPSANGLWGAVAPPPHNKTQGRLLRRILREGALERLRRDIQASASRVRQSA